MQLFGNTNFKKAHKTHGFDTAVFPFSLTDLQSQRKEGKLISFINHSLCVIYVHFFNFSSMWKYLLHFEVSWFLFAALSVCVSEREEGVVEHNTEPSSRGKRKNRSINWAEDNSSLPYSKCNKSFPTSAPKRDRHEQTPDILSLSTGWHSVLTWIFSSSAVILCQSLNYTS